VIATLRNIGRLTGGKQRSYLKMSVMKTHRNISYALIIATLQIMISWTIKVLVVDSVACMVL